MERDVELWLTTKLEEPWSSEKLASQLTVPIIESLLQPHATPSAIATSATSQCTDQSMDQEQAAQKVKFQALDTPIKLRLLFSFISLTKQQNRDLLPSIIEFTSRLRSLCTEEDEWVLTTATLLESLLLNSVAQPDPTSNAIASTPSTASVAVAAAAAASTSPLHNFHNEALDSVLAHVEAFRMCAIIIIITNTTTTATTTLILTMHNRVVCA
jgi:hypothetical protein